MMKSKLIFRNFYNKFNKFSCEKDIKFYPFYPGSYHNISIRCFTKKIEDNVIEELKKRGLINALTRLYLLLSRKIISTLDNEHLIENDFLFCVLFCLEKVPIL